MTIENKSGMLDLVKSVGKIGNHESLVVTAAEYEQLINELFNIDEHLQKRYLIPSAVPQLYSLYGVKINVI